MTVSFISARQDTNDQPGGSSTGGSTNATDNTDDKSNGTVPMTNNLGVVNGLVAALPIVGVPLTGLLKKLGLQDLSVSSSELGAQSSEIQALSAGIVELNRMFSQAANGTDGGPAKPTLPVALPAPIEGIIGGTPLGAIVQSNDMDASGWEGFSSSAPAPTSVDPAQSSATPTPTPSAGVAAVDNSAVTPAESSTMSSAAPTPSAAAAADPGPPGPPSGPPAPPPLPVKLPDGLPVKLPDGLPIKLPIRR